MGIHGLQQAATAIHVHVPVMKWLLHRLSNRLQTGEMDHRINPWRIGEGTSRSLGLRMSPCICLGMARPQAASSRTRSDDRAAVADRRRPLVARLY